MIPKAAIAITSNFSKRSMANLLVAHGANARVRLVLAPVPAIHRCILPTPGTLVAHVMPARRVAHASAGGPRARSRQNCASPANLALRRVRLRPHPAPALDGGA